MTRRSQVLAAALAACLLVSMPGARSLRASRLQEGMLPGPSPIADLVAKAREMDGQTVRIVGEAVGDLMIRGESAWVNVLDASGTAVGVFVPKDEALKIKNLGRYLQQGDVLDIIGTFHNSCLAHDGEPDVHAVSLSVIEQGHPVRRPTEALRAVLAGVLLALAGFMGLAVRRRTTHPTR